MSKIDESIIEALSEVLDISVNNYRESFGTEKQNVNLFRMSFIRKFLDDIIFLNDLSEEKRFYHRYGYLIIRNMLEQFIEFLYVQKNSHLVDEYLGLKIDLDSLEEKHSPVEGERYFGKERYTEKRASIANMAKDIGEYEYKDGGLSLYDVYSILSEKCHNSYFDSLLEEFNAARIDTPTTGLNAEQKTLLYAMIACVLAEYNQ